LPFEIRNKKGAISEIGEDSNSKCELTNNGLHQWHDLFEKILRIATERETITSELLRIAESLNKIHSNEDGPEWDHVIGNLQNLIKNCQDLIDVEEMIKADFTNVTQESIDNLLTLESKGELPYLGEHLNASMAMKLIQLQTFVSWFVLKKYLLRSFIIFRFYQFFFAWTQDFIIL